MKKLFLAVLAVPTVIALAGCAVTNQTSLLVGTPRAAISPAMVKLYAAPPKQYVEIAIISADAVHAFMEKQALLDTAVLNAKKEAAKYGANGILISGAGNFDAGSTGVGFMQASRRGMPAFSTFNSTATTGKQIEGRAIYVTEE